MYAELRNVFDLAVVAALVRSQKLDERIDWKQLFFRDDGKYRTDQGPLPTEVESMINHRLIGRRHIVVGVSGGVAVDAGQFVQPSRIERDEYGLLAAEHAGASPDKLPRDAWWWD